MKIASFNINNFRKRQPNLLDWLREAQPEIVCLQELKATEAEFPANALRKAGYQAVWWGQKSWSGVAILGYWAGAGRSDVCGHAAVVTLRQKRRD
jgi:exodeoxyribonuclease III